MPMISIVIPVFNKFAFTQACLTDLFRQPDTDIEIIIVDNGSTDETQAKLQKIERQNFHYIRNDINTGFGSACNKGYSKSTCDTVCFLNNDIRVKNDNWIT